MAVSRDPGRNRSEAVSPSIVEIPSSVSRYDLVLALIPATFVLAALVGGALSLPVSGLVGVASLAAGLVVADALFVHPPSAPGSATEDEA